jgi:hypothetical protein
MTPSSQKPPTQASQIAQCRNNLDLPISDLPVEALYPVIVPLSFNETGGWPGPFVALSADRLAMTWAVLMPEQTMKYVDAEMTAYWESLQIDWKVRAMENLIAASNDPPWTHEFRDENNQVSFVVLMHEDGIGPSRIFLQDAFKAIFPQGYGISTPEMSCAYVFSLNLSKADEKKLSGLITNCYKDGTRPLSPLRYLPKDFNPVVD